MKDACSASSSGAIRCSGCGALRDTFIAYTRRFGNCFQKRTVSVHQGGEKVNLGESGFQTARMTGIAYHHPQKRSMTRDEALYPDQSMMDLLFISKSWRFSPFKPIFQLQVFVSFDDHDHHVTENTGSCR